MYLVRLNGVRFTLEFQRRKSGTFGGADSLRGEGEFGNGLRKLIFCGGRVGSIGVICFRALLSPK
jgi:hypothetical protein